MFRRVLFGSLAVVLSVGFCIPVSAQFQRNSSAPEIEAMDINGATVKLSELIARQPYLVLVHFFTTSSGAEVALHLRHLDKTYGRDKLGIIALGLREDEKALQQFAAKLDIEYYIIDSEKVANKQFIDQVDTLPLTLFVLSDPQRTIERIVKGGGEAKAELLREVAENLYQQRRGEALEIIEQALAEAPEDRDARELKGFILTAEGKLDEAEVEFGAIDATGGQALVALEQGDTARAAELGAENDDPIARAAAGTALLREGKVAEAAALVNEGDVDEARPWKASALHTVQGRAAHAMGNGEGALEQYAAAVALDPLNIVALSNEAEVHRESGGEENLAKAQQALERAQSVRSDDEMVAIMLRQIVDEQQRANDIARRELIRQQINDLQERYESMQASGAAAQQDDWTSRPLVVALLPGNGSANLFDRAGTGTVLRRELERQIGNDARVNVVEREMLDVLLQELNLGSSELASADTQRRLGQVLSAGALAFVDFARAGKDLMAYVRLVNTETTAIELQASAIVDEAAPLNAVNGLAGELLDKLTRARQLKGLVADASDDNAVIINLGRNHGIEAGQEFAVMIDGDPIEVGGRVIAHRQKSIGKLVVETVEDGYAICRVVAKQDDATIEKEMKIQGFS